MMAGRSRPMPCNDACKDSQSPLTSSYGLHCDARRHRASPNGSGPCAPTTVVLYLALAVLLVSLKVIAPSSRPSARAALTGLHSWGGLTSNSTSTTHPTAIAATTAAAAPKQTTETDPTCFQPHGIYLRRDATFENFGPGSWIRSIARALSINSDTPVLCSQRDYVVLQPQFIDRVLQQQQSCPLAAIVYQHPKDYLVDYRSTNGRIAALRHKIVFGPFGLELISEHATELQGTSFFPDNPGVFDRCKTHVSQFGVRCYYQPQCADEAAIQRGLGIPKSSRARPMLYLKARDGLTWNETIVDAIKASAKRRGIADFRVFVYGRYKHSEFLDALMEANFAVAYSPWETMGLYHIEMRERSVPVFSLSRRGVTLFTPGLSGEIAEAGALVGHPREWNMPFDPTKYPPGLKGVDGLPLGSILASFEAFLDKLDDYDPLEDLQRQRLVPPRCHKPIRRVVFASP